MQNKYKKLDWVLICYFLNVFDCGDFVTSDCPFSINSKFSGCQVSFYPKLSSLHGFALGTVATTSVRRREGTRLAQKNRETYIYTKKRQKLFKYWAYCSSTMFVRN